MGVLQSLQRLLLMPYRKWQRIKKTPAGTIVYGDGSNLTIGSNVSFGGRVVLFGTAPIEIGDNTMIALNVIIHTATHDYTDHPMWRKRIDRPVKIGKHVWIGAAAIIMPGVIIGDYSVIGAGSVVTASIPRGAIVVGNPAKILRFREPASYNREPEIIEHNQSKIIAQGYLDKECGMARKV
jgi:acetyltransferase-like isoleucine patch superfamily enzyme